MGKYACWTTREIALLRQHWMSDMPISVLCAMLPRHSPCAVYAYGRYIGLGRRPGGARKNYRARKNDRWARLSALLEKQPMTAIEIGKGMGISRNWVYGLIRVYRAEIRVAGWILDTQTHGDSGRGRYSAQWALGNGPDASPGLVTGTDRWERAQ